MQADHEQPFSVHPGGFLGLDPDDIITLAYEPGSGNSLQACVAPRYGSNLVDFRVNGCSLIHTDIDRLGSGDFTGNFPMFPYPNRYRGKEVHLPGDRVVSLEKIARPRGGPLLIHGLVFDRPWEVTKQAAHEGSASLTTKYEMSPATEMFDLFPFESRVELTFTLMPDGLELRHAITNLGQRPLAYGFGWHPFFRRLDADDRTTLKLPAREVLEVEESLLPTGKHTRVRGTPYDLTAETPMSKANGLDHFFTAVEPGAASTIDFRDSGLAISIYSSDEFRHMVVYSQEEDFFCVENVTCPPDAHNVDWRGRKEGLPDLVELANLRYVAPEHIDTGWVRYAVTTGG